MSDDLVKRLRWLQAQYENAGQILAEDFKDAADEIEEYERAFSNLHREYDARGDRIEELEANLAKALTALSDVQRFVKDLEPYADQGHTLVPALQKACDVYVELTGGKDE